MIRNAPQLGTVWAQAGRPPTGSAHSPAPAAASWRGSASTFAPNRPRRAPRRHADCRASLPIASRQIALSRSRPNPRSARRRPAGQEALMSPAIRASVLLTASIVSVAADWIRHRHQHASRYGDGDSANEQKDGCEAPNCTELHGCHLPSHHLVSRKRRFVHMAELRLG